MKFQYLKDNFNNFEIDTTVWSSFSSLTTVSQASRNLKIVLAKEQSGTNSAGLITVDTYDLTDSYVSIALLQIPNPDSEAIASFIVRIPSTDKSVRMDILEGNINFSWFDNSETEHDLGSVEYSRDLHKFLRFREEAGEIYFEVSADNLNWTTETSVTYDWTATALELEISGQTTQSESNPAMFVVNNLNYIRPIILPNREFNISAGFKDKLIPRFKGYNELPKLDLKRNRVDFHAFDALNYLDQFKLSGGVLQEMIRTDLYIRGILDEAYADYFTQIVTADTDETWEDFVNLPPTNATGGTITTVGSKKIHTFTTDGNFVIPDNYSGVIDYLIVGGGGGGGNDRGGGGGGGGVRSFSAVSIDGASYPVDVGNGGAPTQQGETSSFKGSIALGGGYGATGGVNMTGNSGGSGGGGAQNASGVGTAGGSGTVGQGSAGGNGVASGVTAASGGGGGAGAVGSNGVGKVGGNGGNGTSSSISGSAVTYGGGGGGSFDNRDVGTAGTGGSGGGGNGGGSSANGSNGTANTGGGAGGGSGGVPVRNGGTGGSGVVIISYDTDGFEAPQYDLGTAVYSFDTDNYTQGDASRKIEVEDGAAGTYVQLADSDLTQFSHIAFDIFTEDISKVLNAKIIIGEYSQSSSFVYDLRPHLQNGWINFSVPREEFGYVGTLPDWSNVEYFLFLIESQAGETLVMNVDNVRLVDNEYYPQQELDIGLNTIPVAWWAGNKALFEIRTAAEAEGGRFYADEEGKLIFRNRQYFNLNPDSKVSKFGFNFNNETDLIYMGDETEIINTVTVSIKPRVIQATTQIWSYGTVPKQIAAGETLEVFAGFSDPVPTTTTGLITPVATTDYLGNADEDGGGADRTSDISIAITKFATGALLEIENTSGTSLYLTMLKIRGTPAIEQSEIVIFRQNEESVTDYGVLPDAGGGSTNVAGLYIENKYLTEEIFAAEFAEQLIEWYGSPTSKIKIQSRAQPQLKIGDMVGVKNDYANKNYIMRITRIKETFDESGYNAMYEMRSVDGFELLNFFTIGISAIEGEDVIPV